MKTIRDLRLEVSCSGEAAWAKACPATTGKGNSLSGAECGSRAADSIEQPVKRPWRLLLAARWLAVLVFLAPFSLRAQWLTQSFALKSGWNAVYLHVDASHVTLNEAIGNDPSIPIQEVWLWAAPPSVQQFVTNPQQPVDGASQWLAWKRSESQSATLQRLGSNVACLIRVSSDYSWHVTGKPVAPNYQWTTSGLNFIGFPAPQGAPPSFEAFLGEASSLLNGLEVFRYRGGEFGAGNPTLAFSLRSTPVNRGEAVWIRTGAVFNRYFGPFEVQGQNPSGASFRDTIGQLALRVRNTTSREITVALNLIASETPPPGQPPIVQAPPLLVRGELNLTDLSYGYSDLNAGPRSWTLPPKGQPGSDIQVILGVNRSAMAGRAGELYAGILRFTDNLGLSQIDLPASAIVSSPAGLWVGGASVTSVGHYLKKFARATNRVDFTNVLARLELVNGANGVNYTWDEGSGRILAFGGTDEKTGAYVLDGPIKTDSGAVAQPFPLRLIVHHDGATSRLLQQVYHGIGMGTSPVVATRQELLLPSALSSAHRISAVHLPGSVNNTPWEMTGSLRQGNSLSATVSVPSHDQLANPFLHTYHPDHDNLDGMFSTVQPQGVESYGISRQITLNFTAPPNDFDGLTSGTQTLTGNYVESVTFQGRGSDTKQFQGLGSFTLKRISDIGTLTQ